MFIAAYNVCTEEKEEKEDIEHEEDMVLTS